RGGPNRPRAALICSITFHSPTLSFRTTAFESIRIMSRSTVVCPIPTSRFAPRPGWFVLAAVIAICGGCGRKYWREQADDLSYDIIAKKELDPRWTLPRLDVRTDPRSRSHY